MSDPAVSVVMSAFNAGASIAHSMSSIVSQTFQDWELLVLDDGSLDNTADIARRFRDPRIRVRADHRRIGLAGRLNEGIRAARGEFIARMDADDVAYPERLALQVAFLRNHPEIDLVGSSAIVFSKTKDAIGVFRVATTHEKICSRPSVGFVLPHPTWLARRAWFERFEYRITAKRAQDQDLLLRAYPTSRFANLSNVLLGYYQDTPKLRHILLGRWHYALAHYRAGRERDGILSGLMGVSNQLIRAAVPAVLVAMGRSDIVLRRRFRAPTAQESARWAAVLDQVETSSAGVNLENRSSYERN